MTVAGVDTALLEESEGILRHDDARIHEHANRDGDTGEAHDVGGNARVVHAQERQQNRERQRKRDNQDRSEVHQEDDVRQGDEGDFLDQSRPQSADGLLDQIRAVIERHDGDALREPRLDLRDARLDSVDDVFRVDASAGDDDTADSFLCPFHERRHAKGVADLDICDLVHVDRNSVRVANDDPLDVINRFDEADAAHDQPRAVRLKDIAADIQVALAHGGDHRAEGQVVGPETIRVDIDLVLLDVATNRRHFGDAGDRIELVSDEPILQGP